MSSLDADFSARIAAPPALAPAIYVHVPFCEQKCAYCDFFTITDAERKHPLAARWLDLAARELELWSAEGAVRHKRDSEGQIPSIFFGGGTPSLLEPDAIADFIKNLDRKFGLLTDCEITLETQPGTADAARLAAFARAGINRFSIGVQTFSDRLLAPTGRRHTAADSRETIEGALATGRTVSLDLIAALPGQTFADWQWELEQALAYANRPSPAAAVQHISVYELTFHTGTKWHRDLSAARVAEADEELRIDMFRETERVLADAGFEHYEVSNYARPGARSRHNLTYWSLGDYIGLGAGAHSLIWPHRWQNPHNAGAWAATIEAGKLPREPSDPADREIFLLENLSGVLRRLDGIDTRWFADKTGTDLLREPFATPLRRFVRDGLLTLEGCHLQLTPEGVLQSDLIVESLLA